MPLIQVIPTAKTQTAAPGWAYVLEPAIDPSRLPLTADGPRSAQSKRAAARTATDIIVGANTKSQATKTRLRLEELAKDNPTKHEIAVPDGVKRELAEARWKVTISVSGAKAGVPTKMTSNVRKVLGSDKNWAHHAADVQAELELAQAAEANDRRKVRISAAVPIVPEDVQMADVEGAPDEVEEPEKSAQELAAEILMHVNVPEMPSQLELDALSKAPPLTYAAATAGRAASRDPDKTVSPVPTRRFCAMCGYWGKIKCTLCGDSVCGLTCKRTHDAAEHIGR